MGTEIKCPRLWTASAECKGEKKDLPKRWWVTRQALSAFLVIGLLIFFFYRQRIGKHGGMSSDPKRREKGSASILQYYHLCSIHHIHQIAFQYLGGNKNNFSLNFFSFLDFFLHSWLAFGRSVNKRDRPSPAALLNALKAFLVSRLLCFCSRISASLLPNFSPSQGNALSRCQGTWPSPARPWPPSSPRRTRRCTSLRSRGRASG